MIGFPAHTTEDLPWNFSRKPPRGVKTWTASVPPFISSLHMESIPSDTRTLCYKALLDLAFLEANGGSYLSSFEPFLLRTEALSSSRIESEDANVDAAVCALTSMTRITPGRPLTLKRILTAHKYLMEDDPMDKQWAGKIRTVPNWIGGAATSPLGASHVPPAPERVPELLDDLLTWCNRDDLDPIIQAAIAHAQFESIHPFTDGNGRIGRTLFTAIWRRRNILPTAIAPISCALIAARETYFTLLNHYRDGDIWEYVNLIATLTSLACRAARDSIPVFADAPQRWKEAHGLREKTVAFQLASQLPQHPVIDVDDVRSLVGCSPSSAYRALQQLTEAGVLRLLVDTKRDQLWGAAELLDESELLLSRIASEVDGIY